MEKLLDLIDLVNRRIVMAIYIVVVLLGFLQVVSRYIFNYPIIWIDELSKYLFVWLAFLGVALASKRKAHFIADFFVNMLPAIIKRPLALIARLFSLGFLGACVWYIPNLMEIAKTSISSTVGIPLSWVYAGMLVGFFLTLIVEVAEFYAAYFSKPVNTSNNKGSETSC